DAVVDDRGRAGAVDVRMGVLFGRTPVGRPSRVADAGVAGRRPLRDDRGEIVELAFGPPDLERVIALDGHPGGVVAAVLETAQSGHEERKRLARPGVADDPAHG